MRASNRGALREQVSVLRRQFLQDGGLPFTDVLTEDVITHALATVGRWLDRVFTPVVTLWVFLGQALAADPSCRAAVARLVAHRASRGLKPCSSRTGAYCQARTRLPERFFSAVARRVGRNLDERVDRRWLWKGCRVCLFDGTTVSMPDTARNRAEYPLAYNQARDQLRPRAGRGGHRAVVRGDPRPGHLPVRRQGPGGGQPAPPAVGRAPARRRDAGGPPDVGVGRHAPAEAARGRHRQPPVGAPAGRLPQGEAAGHGRPPGAVGEADVDPVGGPAGVQRATRRAHRPRGPLPGGPAGVPDPVGRRGDDAPGPEAGDPGGTGFALPGPVEQRAGPCGRSR